MRRSLFQVIGIIIVSGAVGIAVNMIRANGIPLVEHWEDKVLHEQVTGGLPAVSFKQVKEAYESSEALFVDARDSDFYEEGHIPGAVNLPVREFDLVFPKLKERMLAAAWVITYCDDASCELSVQLTEKLLFAGIDRIEVFTGGIQQWQGAGQPVEEGP
jgi:rhodanese-related sulfurtransferase